MTRESLTNLIGQRTPTATARALESAELARVELESGTTGRAIELLDAALRLDAQAVPPYVLRARAYLAEGQVGAAHSDLDRAAKLAPDAPWLAEIVAVTGTADEADGRPDLALAAYRRALLIFPANRTARDGLRRLSAP